MTTGGEGGMIVTWNRDLWERCWSYRDHGKSFQAAFHKEHPPGYRWLHTSFGTNGRMTEMQAAIGRIQLTKLDRWLNQRRRNAAILKDALADFPCVTVPQPPSPIEHAYYKFYIQLIPEKIPHSIWTRDRIMAAIQAEGIPCLVGSCGEIYLENAFVGTGFTPSSRLPSAKRLGEVSLMFMVHPTIDDATMLEISLAIRKVFQVVCQK